MTVRPRDKETRETGSTTNKRPKKKKKRKRVYIKVAGVFVQELTFQSVDQKNSGSFGLSLNSLDSMFRTDAVHVSGSTQC